MAKTTKVARKSARPGFLNRTGLFGFELFMALFGLIATLVVIDYGIFALFNYLYNAESMSSFLGDFMFWILAAMLVWLPVTAIFYLRSRAGIEQKPEHTQSTLYKVLVSIYYFFLIVVAIGLLFAAVFMLIRLAMSPYESISETLMRTVVPALVAVVVHFGMTFAFAKSHRPSRKVFITSFSLVVVLLAGVLVAVSAGSIRDMKKDEVAVSDLERIRDAVTNYKYKKSSVPSSLAELEELKDDVKQRLSNYSYQKVDDNRYQICADFVTDTRRSNTYMTYPAVINEGDEYVPYAYFASHDKGQVCYKTLATYDDLKMPAESRLD